MVRASQYLGPLALVAGSIVAEASDATLKVRMLRLTFPHDDLTKSPTHFILPMLFQ